MEEVGEVVVMLGLWSCSHKLVQDGGKQRAAASEQSSVETAWLGFWPG
jgi:hypothetical protein